ncbi:MAG TPA: TldD/PmbA family protein [Firmicutes bacterium]|nr:TldD/PmbA family protein [Candidatus Fermentithermobacillaceae bacterium]
MLGKDKVRRITDESIEYGLASGATQVEASVTCNKSYLTRYAMNHINHNTGCENSRFTARVVLGKRTGSASIGSLDPVRVKAAVDQAITLARLADPDPNFKGLPVSEPVSWEGSWSKDTKDLSPDGRAGIVSEIVGEARRNRLEAAGIIANEEEELAVKNSLGLDSYQKGTSYAFTVTSMSATGSGYARSDGWDIKNLDWRELAEPTMEKALSSQNPVSVEPGVYEVILESNASAVLFNFFTRLALSGRAYLDGRSLVSGRLGEKFVSEKLDIFDDGLDLRGVPRAFDSEGMPKKRLELVSKGHVVNVCYDSYTAGLREGLESTGHEASFRSYKQDPFPANVFVEPGTSTVEDMISSTKRGLWITRFHYTNPIDPYHIVVTGMTRDAMFLIEDGKVVAPVRPMRFTQNVVEALSGIQALGGEIQYIGGYIGGPKVGQAVPAVKIDRFNFTGRV